MPEGHEKPTLTRNKPQCKCATPYCRNKRRRDRPICSKCYTRKFRANNPIAAAYDLLRGHARGRGIPFLITKEEFKKFCDETNYHLLKGQEPDSITVDRRDPDGPYSYDNIRPLGHLVNSTRRDAPLSDDPKYIPPDDQPF